MRQRNLQFRARSKRGGHARHDFDGYVVFIQKGNFLVRAAEQHRIATLEAHHHAMRARGIGEPLVDEALRGRVAPAALAHGDFLCSMRQQKYFFGHQGVVKHDIRLAEQPDRANREEVRSTRSGADEIDRARRGGVRHWTIPAATVWLVASSMRIRAPVARTDS